MLEIYQESIDKITEAGFDPILVTRLMFEDTFVFETKDEAQRAYQLLEVEQKIIQGWWYGFDDFLVTLKDYKTQFGHINDIFRIK